ncbi:MAG: GGDEF domain-containing protein [Chloroflexi bacterium]|nr:GGDEF domain-containing protein [Chloroflexota bacterium]
MACIMIDIDNFRQFNSQHGHLAGDWVLKSAAGCLVKNLRKVDIVARYGGDEFVILQPRSTLENASKRAKSLCKMVATQIWESPYGRLNITISLGISASPPAPIPEDHCIIEYADKALYEAKRRGGNCAVVDGHFSRNENQE